MCKQVNTRTKEYYSMIKMDVPIKPWRHVIIYIMLNKKKPVCKSYVRCGSIMWHCAKGTVTGTIKSISREGGQNFGARKLLCTTLQWCKHAQHEWMPIYVELILTHQLEQHDTNAVLLGKPRTDMKTMETFYIMSLISYSFKQCIT